MSRLVNRRFWMLLLLVCTAWTPAWAEPGSLLLIGGGNRPPALMRKFIELAGGPNAVIVIVPTASELPDAGSSYVKEFARYGCKRVHWLRMTSRGQATRGEWQALMPRAGGIWFTGGDQVRLLRVCGGTPFEVALRAAHQRGAVIGGTSAGTACMSRVMITGDGSPKIIADDPPNLSRGFGLFPGIIVDQHFVIRQRLNRLIAAVALHPRELGVGVDEATAVWRKPDGSFVVLGNSQVVVVDAGAAQVRRLANGKLGVRDLRVHVLLPGDTWPPAVPAPAP